MALDQLLTQLEVCTDGPGFTPLNQQLNQLIAEAGLSHGVIHLTCLHTSCSLTINENADPRVLKDLAAWMDAVVPQDGLDLRMRMAAAAATCTTTRAMTTCPPISARLSPHKR